MKFNRYAIIIIIRYNSITIRNLPFQGGGYEGIRHLGAKMSIAHFIDRTFPSWDIWYEMDVISRDGKWEFHLDIYIEPDVYVEIDGKTHSSRRAKSKDKWKDEELRYLGLKGIRIEIEEALEHPEQIVTKLNKLKKRK